MNDITIFAMLVAATIGIAQMCLPCGPNVYFGIGYPFDGKPSSRNDVRLRLIALTAAAVAIACLSGLILGTLGSVVESRLFKFNAVPMVSIGLLGLGVLSFTPLRLHLPQRDLETPPPWTRKSGLAWSIIDGLLLGVGCATRIEYATWFAVPWMSLVLASPVRSAIVFGSYGLGRMIGTLVIPMAFGRASSSERPRLDTLWLLEQIKVANKACGLLAISIGLFLLGSQV